MQNNQLAFILQLMPPPQRNMMNEEYIEIELEEEPIELCKLLKVLDLVEGGGQAKKSN